MRFLSFRDGDGACACATSFEDDRLLVDATDCPGHGDLADEPACRETVVGALADRDAASVVTRSDGVERAYEEGAAALLVAAGRFVERVAFHDSDLAARARRDPLGAAREATGRAGPVADVAAETGLAVASEQADDYANALRPFVSPVVGRARVAVAPPADATLRDRRTLDTGATARVYDVPAVEPPTYHLVPVEYGLDRAAQETLAGAFDRLASGSVGGGRRAPGRAVRGTAGDGDPVEVLARVLEKHTRGHGVLADFFADPAVSDVYATAPVDENHLWAVVDGETMATNVRLTADGARTLASRFRRESGRAFSRANPTLDAVADAGEGGIRVAGVTEPASDGVAFAFRARDEGGWTLPALVANGTMPADAAALLSLAVERDAAGLVAGTRGAGKTTLLGALLWELPATTRTVAIEDTPELPVDALQREGRDVQALRTDPGETEGLSPTAALRTALRLGEGALVVGEVRGEEARVLYEAMRVGASGSAVLGTIHGDGAAAVRERVVSDLGVPVSSFAATDFVATVQPHATDGGRVRRLAAIEEVRRTDDGCAFEPLFAFDDELRPTGRIERGTSRLVEHCTRPGESYADVLDELDAREAHLDRLAEAGLTEEGDVASAHAKRRNRGEWRC